MEGFSSIADVESAVGSRLCNLFYKRLDCRGILNNINQQFFFLDKLDQEIPLHDNGIKKNDLPNFEVLR